MENVIINSDSLKYLKTLESSSIDLIFADPPYYMRTGKILHRVEGTEFHGCNDDWDKFNSLEDYEKFSREWLSECRRILKPNASIWVIGSMQCIYTLGSIMQELNFWLINDVIWQKSNPTPNFMGTRLNNSHETLIWAARDKNSHFTFNYKTAKALNADLNHKQMGSIWKFPVCSGGERLKDSDGNKLHSTQKPLILLERIIAISSRINDLVLDPFGGTMTTAAAAKKLGRRYIMIERNESYCKAGKIRLDAIEFEDSPVARADFDIKPMRVSMQEMISAGYFFEGENFYLSDGKPCAKLNSDGKLLLDGKILDMHTAAALAKGLKAKRVNGFDFWQVMRGDTLVKISEIRENYRHEQEKTGEMI